MKILALDTANNSASVAISDDDKILAYKEELRPGMQAETILPMIESALKSAGLVYSDINYLAVTNGPGSFTGIRIGLSVAKGILFASNIQGIAVSNFEFSYYRAIGQIKNYDKIFIFLNAYRGQLYGQIFDRNNDVSSPMLIEYDIAIELLKSELSKPQQGSIVCAGSGLALLYSQIQYLPNLIILPRFTRVKALHLCKYVHSKLLLKQPVNNIIDPLYVRPHDAKIKFLSP